MPPEYHREYSVGYQERPGVRERQAKNQKRYREDSARRHKHVARWSVNHAIESGKIQRQPCEVCAEPRAEAHHDDYSKPLDVRWLCRKHHREHHAKAESNS